MPKHAASKRHGKDVVLSRALAFALVSISLLISSCAVAPVRLPSRAKDMSGNSPKIDLSFLKSGSTTRKEVTENLAPIDTHVNQNGFFWGRWESSDWGVGYIAVFGGVGGGRVWGIHNLLIELDQQGVVKNWVVVDDKSLYQQLDQFDNTASLPLDLPAHAKADIDTPVYSGDGKYRTAIADLVLSADFFECANVEPTRDTSAPFECVNVKTQRANIQRITPSPSPSFGSLLGVTIHFAKSIVVSQNPPWSHKPGHPYLSKSLTLRVDPSTLLLLRRYVKQTPH